MLKNINKSRLKQILATAFLIFLFVMLADYDLSGQCPMCKISAESNMRDGGTAGRGLNSGILYMFALPYLLIGTLGYLWYKNRKNYDQEPE